MKFKFRNMVFAALAFIFVASTVPSKAVLGEQDDPVILGFICSDRERLLLFLGRVIAPTFVDNIGSRLLDIGSRLLDNIGSRLDNIGSRLLDNIGSRLDNGELQFQSGDHHALLQNCSDMKSKGSHILYVLLDARDSVVENIESLKERLLSHNSHNNEGRLLSRNGPYMDPIELFVVVFNTSNDNEFQRLVRDLDRNFYDLTVLKGEGDEINIAIRKSINFLSLQSRYQI